MSDTHASDPRHTFLSTADLVARYGTKRKTAAYELVHTRGRGLVGECCRRG